jgi:NAD(P)-dependent dehydrogenase (short-subunit alcohol dehydrogenase family)/threonine dehydrogenase-like Zn-dependent dehydrogenase
MKAFVITGPREAGVQDVAPPAADPGEVVVDVQRAGVCGTDIELYTGEMHYLHDGFSTYPLRIGHEWMGTVSAIGDRVDDRWLGRRVTGDTMPGCGVCRRCRSGYQPVCEFRGELGIRDARPGALAEQAAVPAASLRKLPDAVDDVLGALVAPGGNALRSVQGAALVPGDRDLVSARARSAFWSRCSSRAAGAEVLLMGRNDRSLDFARTLRFDDVWTEENLPDVPWDAVVEASNAPHLPAKALELVEPGKRVVYVGLAGSPSRIDTRTLALNDVTAVGILSASPGLTATVEAYASAAVDPGPLVAAPVGPDDLAPVLAGERPPGAGPPQDPRRHRGRHLHQGEQPMRTAVITGGGRGLGASTAERLRRDGVRTVTIDLAGDVDHHLDITDEAAVNEVAARIGAVDILINSAGIVGPGDPLLTTRAEDWRRVFEVNVLGTVAAMRAFVPGMVERGWGRVVNFASMAGKDGNPNLSIYSASKGAVIALTKSVGKELAMTGVLVNAVAPAVIATPMNAETAPDALEHITSLIPMKRVGRPEEVAELVAWLCSDAVSFSTGAVYDISGGRATY